MPALLVCAGATEDESCYFPSLHFDIRGRHKINLRGQICRRSSEWLSFGVRESQLPDCCGWMRRLPQAYSYMGHIRIVTAAANRKRRGS